MGTLGAALFNSATAPTAAAALTAILVGASASAQGTSRVGMIPDAVAATGETILLSLHAEGAQVYDCKADQAGRLVWQFREPIATLMEDGRTVGRHYVGPTWEHVDGSRVMAKPVGRADGATSRDIPWLKLEVTQAHGNGALSGATTIQRLNTSGGQREGVCEHAGTTLAVPYSADYVFLRK
jgi:hypothetical protein